MTTGEVFTIKVTDAQYEGTMVTTLDGATGALINNTNHNAVLSTAQSSTALQSIEVTVNGNQYYRCTVKTPDNRLCYAGFLILADLYWKRKGKRMRMLPVYADKKHRRITFGEIIQYNPENNTKDEQERILRETRDQIMTMAGLADPFDEQTIAGGVDAILDYTGIGG